MVRVNPSQQWIPLSYAEHLDYGPFRVHVLK